MNGMEKFCGQKNGYAVSKTIRFELQPVGKTRENFLKSEFLERDEIKSRDYQNVKKIIDECHKKFIDDVLKNSSFDWKPLADATEEFIRTKKSEESRKKLSGERKKMREKIAKKFSEENKEQYKKLTDSTPSKLLKEILQNDAEISAEDKKSVETFRQFATYFSGFQKNRQNVYSGKEISTAVPYRIVHENFPKFFQNAVSFGDIQKKCPQVISQAEKELSEILGGTKLAEIFSVEKFNDFLCQGGAHVGIDFYNKIIGGEGQKEGDRKIRGMNEFLNLYRQQNAEFAAENKKIKFLPLYKQILSDRSSAFTIQSIDSDEELKFALTEFFENAEKFIDPAKTAEIFEKIADFDLNAIFVNRKDLSFVSKILTGNWNFLQNCMNVFADEKFSRKLMTKTELNRWKKSEDAKSDDFFSFEELNEVLSYCSGNLSAAEIRMEDYFGKTFLYRSDGSGGKFEKSSEICEMSVSEICKKIRGQILQVKEIFAAESAEKSIRENHSAVEKIKNCLDEFQNLFHRIKPLKTNEPGDTNFYSEYEPVYDALEKIMMLYNKTRNYISRKIDAPKKIRLNFDTPTLAAGWDKNKENDDLAVIFIKNGFYYLGIMNPKSRKVLENPPESETDDVFQKMELKLTKDVTTTVPKCTTEVKLVKAHFANENTDFELFDKKTFLKPITITRKIFDLNNKTFNGKKKFQIEYSRQTGDVVGYKDAVVTWIDFCKEFLVSYKSTANFNYDSLKKSDSYENLKDFYDEVNEKLYSLKFKQIDKSYIDKLVDDGKLFLFKIHSKDFAPGTNGTPNLHTLYWKGVFDERNLQNGVIRLNGGARIFYRKKIQGEPVVHGAGTKLVNKTTQDGKIIPQNIYSEIYEFENGRKTEISDEAQKFREENKIVVKTASHEIIKDRRFYCEDKFLFHVPVTINFNAEKQAEPLNVRVRKFLKNNPDVSVIGLDRGERHLIYLSLINRQGEILRQFTFNQVERNKNGRNIKVDYHAKLDAREKERDEAKKSWSEIGKIADLKEGYLSAVVHQIAKIMVENNAVVVMEELNSGFKRGRFHVEKQVYQKFEKALIEKLNYLVFKDRDFLEAGGVLNGYQLTEKFESFVKMYRQSGFLFYVDAGYTSKIDPKTGFANLFSFANLTSVTKKKEFFSKFGGIRYDAETSSFAFSFNYKKFGGRGKNCLSEKDWTVYSREKRIVYSSKNKSYAEIFPTEEFKKLFSQNGIRWESGENLSGEMQKIGGNLQDGEKPDKKICEFWDGMLRNFKLTVQMRNSCAKTGEDFILSPVKCADGTFFDSRIQDEKFPENADANGAYHIALKGLQLLKRFDECENEKLKSAPLKIEHEEWFDFAQKKADERVK
jgi:CRISPR-associated protein Cpf1